jgi:hypothetical protein
VRPRPRPFWIEQTSCSSLDGRSPAVKLSEAVQHCWRCEIAGTAVEVVVSSHRPLPQPQLRPIRHRVAHMSTQPPPHRRVTELGLDLAARAIHTQECVEEQPHEHREVPRPPARRSVGFRYSICEFEQCRIRHQRFETLQRAEPDPNVRHPPTSPARSVGQLDPSSARPSPVPRPRSDQSSRTMSSTSWTKKLH